jgi:hypothetical protein
MRIEAPGKAETRVAGLRFERRFAVIRGTTMISHGMCGAGVSRSVNRDSAHSTFARTPSHEGATDPLATLLREEVGRGSVSTLAKPRGHADATKMSPRAAVYTVGQPKSCKQTSLSLRQPVGHGR